LSPTQTRETVQRIGQKFSISERRACRCLGFSRTSVRYRTVERNDEGAIRQRLRTLARKRSRFGYRRLTHLLRREGFRVSFKRVHRLYKLEGLRVHRRPKRKADHWPWREFVRPTESGASEPGLDVGFPLRPDNQGQSPKWFSIVDEHTRQCITLDVGRKTTSEDVIDRLATLFVMYGVPSCIRSDNGPEFVSQANQRWLASLDVRTLYVEPGSPWQNGYVESFHNRLRDELLNLEQFDSARHARAHASAWQEDYNEYRPHGSLDGLTLNEFARRCADSASSAAQTPLHQHTDLPSVTQTVLS
jgi:putative transposase